MGRKSEYFSRDNREANGYLKRCSASVSIQEMQIKAKMSYHLTPVGTVIMKKTKSKC